MEPVAMFGILRGCRESATRCWCLAPDSNVAKARVDDIETDIAPEELTMPPLQEFILESCKGMVDGVELDKILRGFTLPSLTAFWLTTEAHWTGETFEILKRQYNLLRLQEVGFIGGFALPVFSVLYNSPMLHLLSLERDAIFDDEAITGISNDTLGQFLKTLEFNYTACDRDIEVVGMVEARKKKLIG